MNRSLLYPRATTTRRLIGLDGMWRFSFDPESKGVEAGWALDLPSSLSMPVPASFCDLFTDKASREYCGDFWYETSFFVPAEWSGWDIVLRFGSVTHRARVFVNGVEVAQHEGGFLPFDATVTNIVRYNQFNKLSVLANNELSETMLPAGTTRTLADGRKIAAPYFDFYNYAGIHRPVWLMALPKERVLDYSTRYRLTETGAEIDYTVTTNGPHPVTVELYDGTTRVAESSGTTGTLVVKNAKLWNVHAAYLYDLVIRIHEGSAVVDEYLDRIGIRTFEIRHGRFLLNGSPVYLRGFGRHEDADIRGRGLDLPTVKRDFELMKWIGANCFRTSHYPYAEEIYQMADEEGFLIIDEVPAVGFMQSTANFLAANQGNGRQQGFSWKELGKMIGAGVKTSASVLLVFPLIGMLTALWRASGTLPFIICCAVDLIRPQILLLMTFLLNCGVSMLTGTAFGTAATMGTICVSVGISMGMDPVLLGGAMLSGVYFGDRCSPASSSASGDSIRIPRPRRRRRARPRPPPAR